MIVRIDKLLYAISRLVNPQRQIFCLTYLCYADTDKVILSEEHKNFLWATRKQLEELLTKPMLDDLILNSVMEQFDII